MDGVELAEVVFDGEESGESGFGYFSLRGSVVFVLAQIRVDLRFCHCC